MKVFLLSAEFPPLRGGVGDYSRELGQGLAALGAEVHVITSVQGDSSPEGLAVHPLIRHWGWGCWVPIVRAVKHERPQVVHIQYQTAAYGMHLRPHSGMHPCPRRRFHGPRVGREMAASSTCHTDSGCRRLDKLGRSHDKAPASWPRQTARCPCATSAAAGRGWR